MMIMLRDDYDTLIKTAAFVLIFRTVDPDLYYRFLDNDANDEEVANALFARMEQNYRSTKGGQNLELEIIMAAAEDDLNRGRYLDSTRSQLLRAYCKLVKEENDHKLTQRDPDWEHAITITEFVAGEQQTRLSRGRSRAFGDTVDRLEMFSSDLRRSLPQPAAS